MAASYRAGRGNDLDALFAAYRDVLVRVRDQGENFDRSEAVDVLQRIAESAHITDHQRLDMLRTVIRAAAEMELDDDAELEIAMTTGFLNGSGVND